jgi:hypothetical protein
VSEAEKISYLAGRRLHEYLTEELGHFHLLTDVVGGFSSTRDLTLYVQKALDLLAVNGSLYTLLSDVQFHDGSRSTARVVGIPIPLRRAAGTFCRSAG